MAETLATKRGRPLKDEVNVIIGGRLFTGWEQVSIEKSLESLSNIFSIQLYDKFTGLRQNWPLKPGVTVKVNIGSERVITGRIETLQVDYTDERRGFQIGGRSLNGDLVDCMHNGDMEYKNTNIVRLAETLVKPFGLRVFESVFGNVEPPTIDKFTLKPGETVFEALDRAARTEGLIFISTRAGNIRLTRAGATEARFRAFSSLEQDINILSATATFDDSKRHNEYIFKGQTSGLPDFFGEGVTFPEGKAFDRGVTRHRPLVQIAEGNADSTKAQTRAEWEAGVRLAKALRVECRVPGWKQANETLWGINQIVRFKSAFLGLNADLLIIGVNHVDGTDEGKTTNITLTDPNAYKPEPEKNKAKKENILDSLGTEFK